MSKNIVALLKGFVIPTNDGIDNRIAVSTVQSKLMQYGYMLDENAFLEMGKADLSWIKEFHDEVIPYLNENMGAINNKEFQPLYKNFPQEVMSLSDSQLFWNAIIHYWSNGTWEPNSNIKFEKDIKFENIKYNILKYVNIQSFNNIFTKLLDVNTSLTPVDLSIVKEQSNYIKTIWTEENIQYRINKAADFKLKNLIDKID